jgi:hypothetical protein
VSSPVPSCAASTTRSCARTPRSTCPRAAAGARGRHAARRAKRELETLREAWRRERPARRCCAGPAGAARPGSPPSWPARCTARAGACSTSAGRPPAAG